MKKKHNHNFPSLSISDRHGERITVTINGDCFLEDLTCKDCGLTIQRMYSNKHAEYTLGDKFVYPNYDEEDKLPPCK